MGQWLSSLIPWGTEVIIWVQSFRNPVLDALFTLFTLLGEEEFYLVFIPFLYWCVHKQVGLALAYLRFFSGYVNTSLKDIFAIPRPSAPRVAVLRHETSPAFPSGHAQGSTVTWGYLASRWPRRAFAVAAVVLILLISLSRVYLGVHYPQDLIGGWVLGGLLLAVYIWAVPRLGPWLAEMDWPVQVALAVVIPLALFLLHPVASTAMTMGAVIGTGVGQVMERRWVRFSVEGSWRRRGVRFLVGLVLLLLAYGGLKAVFPAEGVAWVVLGLRLVRYGIVGWVGICGAPWVFVKAGLANGGREMR